MTEQIESELLRAGRELSELVHEICEACAQDILTVTEELQFCIIIRIRSIFDAVLSLVQSGHAFDGWPLVRAMLEWLFVVVALARQESHTEDFIRQDAYDVARLARGIISVSMGDLSNDDRKVIEHRLDEGREAVTVPIKEWAKRADMLNRYETAYRYLSIRSHACVRQLDRLLYLDSDGSLAAYRSMPMEPEPGDLVQHAVSWLQEAIASLPSRWVSPYRGRASALGVHFQTLVNTELPD